MMRIVRWVLGVAVGAVVTIVAVVLLLDTFGGFLFDGPLGPIPVVRLKDRSIQTCTPTGPISSR
jgi:hypothetical protein